MGKRTLRVVNTPITKQYIQELVEKYMAMGKDKLLETAKAPSLPVLDYSICNILVKCIPTGNFKPLHEFIDETVERLERVPVAVERPPELSEVVDDSLDAMDFGDLREQLARSVFASTKLMAAQAVHEYHHIAKLRDTIGRIEDKLFSPETLKRLPEPVLAKVYQSASTNLSNSVNYIRSVNSNLTQQLDVINQIQEMRQKPAEKDTGANNPAVAQIRELIAKKIREKSVIVAQEQKENQA
jgi:hypothetical protein